MPSPGHLQIGPNPQSMTAITLCRLPESRRLRCRHRRCAVVLHSRPDFAELGAPTVSDYARWFRDSMPYISAHRGSTFVVLLGGDTLAHDDLANVIHDLALLHVLGVRLVLVHGAREQIDARLTDADLSRASPDYASRRHVAPILGVIGELRGRIEALFSHGPADQPATQLEHLGGGWQPGTGAAARCSRTVIDHLFTGSVRRVRAARHRQDCSPSATSCCSRRWGTRRPAKRTT